MGVVTFSPVREKVTKERTAVALNAAGRRHKRCSDQGGMRRFPCSGGIVTQPAKMWLSEYRIAAVCAFEQGKIGRGGWCLPLGANGRHFPRRAGACSRRNLLFLDPHPSPLRASRRGEGIQPQTQLSGWNPLSSHSAAWASYLSVTVTFHPSGEIYHPPSADITAKRYHIPASAGIYHCCQRLR